MLCNIGVFGVNLVGLFVGLFCDIDVYVVDVDCLECFVFDNFVIYDDCWLLSLILLVCDYVVYGWVLVLGLFMLCVVFNVLL